MFFLSADERFLVKTVTKAEGKLLRQLLQGYVDHVIRHPNTLLTRFYGLHRVAAAQGHRRKVCGPAVVHVCAVCCAVLYWLLCVAHVALHPVPTHLSGHTTPHHTQLIACL